MRHLISLSGVALMISLSSTSTSQDAPGAPMITQNNPIVQNNNAFDSALKTKDEFKRAYFRAGKPKLAIFWNRKLDDQLSQWYTSSRNIDTRKGWWSGGKGFTATQERLDVEGRFDDRAQPNELLGFQFGAGFTRTLINTGADIVDRDTIMRLTHSQAKEAADNIIVADYQQIEIDALIGYADYIAEILYTPSQPDSDQLTFLISVKEVKTGRLVAMFPSYTTTDETNYTYEWVTTPSGYEKVKVPVVHERSPYDSDNVQPGTPEHIGWNVAMETMAALTKHWKTKH